MTIASVLEVLITGDSRPLQLALAQASASTTAFASTTASASTGTATATKTMTGALSAVKLTAVGAGIALGLFAKNALDNARSYERAFGRIDAITNTSSARIAMMREEIMRLSGETAQAPTELAESFYFLASAGLTVAEQNEALIATAQGAAVGLGEAADIAIITAQALNLFAQKGLTATAVVDTLVAAVREGTAEPEAFAGALGRVLPVAAKAGIEFDEVTASLATMSNAGLDVHEGVTALRAVMQSLLAPTNQTENALASIGLTTDELRRSLAEDGLIATLRMLDEETNGNIDTLRELIPNIRGMVGAFNLTEQEAAEVDRIFQEVKNSTGSLADAMEATARNPAFRLEQAIQKINNTGQELASDVLPALASALGAVAGAISGVSDFFESQPALVNALKVALVAFIGLKLVSFFQSWAVGSAAAATANAANAGAIAATGAASAAAAGPTFLMGRAVAAEGVAAAGAATANTAAAGATSLFSRALSGLASKVGPIIAIVGAFKALDFASKAWEARMSGDKMLAGKIISDAANFFGLSQIDVGPAPSQVASFSAGIKDVNEALRTNVISVEDAILATHNLAEEYDVNLPDNIDQVIRKEDMFTASMAHNRVAALEAQQTAEDLARTMKQAAQDAGASSKAYAGVQMDLQALADIGGTSLQVLRAEGKKAFEDDGARFGEKWHEFTQGVIDDVSAMTEEISDSVNFIDEQMAPIFEQKTPTAGGILGAFNDAAAATKAFGQDLNEIAGIGNGAGQDLSLWLASLGEEGQATADVIANSSAAMQRSMVTAFNRGQNAADQVANRMQRQIVGTLNEIESLLRFLVTGEWEIPVTSNAKKAKNEIESLASQLANITSKTWVIEMDVQGGGGVPPAAHPGSGNAPPGGGGGGGGGRTHKRQEAYLDRSRFATDQAYDREYEGWR